MSLVQMFRSREAELREEVAWFQQERQELQHSMSLLELDNQELRDEIQQLRGEAAGAPFQPVTLDATLTLGFNFPLFSGRGEPGFHNPEVSTCRGNRAGRAGQERPAGGGAAPSHSGETPHQRVGGRLRN